MRFQPTRAELAVRYGDVERAERRRDLIASGLLMGVLFANVPLFSLIEKTPGSVVIGAAAVVAELATALVYAARSRSRYRDADVCCPSCGAVFEQALERQLVVTTGNCVKCSAAIARDAGSDAFAGPEYDERRAGSSWRYALAVVAILLAVAIKVDAWNMIFAPRRPANLPYLHASGPVVGLTVQEAAARIEAVNGRPSIVILYSARPNRGRLTRSMFSAFAAMAYRHPEVDVLAFDGDAADAPDLPAFLRDHRADFAPLYLHDWPDGDLAKAMAPLGIKVDSLWCPPLVAIRDANGFVVMQGDGMFDVRAMERALDRLRP
jgi:hypothetical protein